MKQWKVNRLPNKILESVGRDLQTTFAGINFTQEEINELEYIYKPFKNKLEEIIQEGRSQKFNNRRSNLNKVRKKLYSALKHIAKANSYSINSEKNILAKQILNIFKLYDQTKKGGSYEMQTIKFDSILNEIDELFSETQLDFIGFTPIFIELKEMQNEFNRLMFKANTDLVEIERRRAISLLKGEYINFLDTFANTLTFIHERAPSENYAKLINATANIITKALLDAKAMQKKNAKDKRASSLKNDKRSEVEIRASIAREQKVIRKPQAASLTTISDETLDNILFINK